MLETKRLEDQVWPAIVVPLYHKHFRREIDKAIPVDYDALLCDTEMTNMLSYRRVLRIQSTKQKMIAKNNTEEVIHSIFEYLTLKD